jgi:hypothetical protein
VKTAGVRYNCTLLGSKGSNSSSSSYYQSKQGENSWRQIQLHPSGYPGQQQLGRKDAEPP